MANKLHKPTNAIKDDFPDFANGQEFDALSEADKEKVFNYYDSHKKLTGLHPLTKLEKQALKAERAADRKKMGRPVIGEGSRQIAVTIEAGLLREVDQFAKAKGLKRAQMIAQGLRHVISMKGASGRKSHRRRSA